MIWILVALSVIAGLMLFLLLTPFVIRVDTSENEYSAILRGIAGARVMTDTDELIIIRYRIFFLKAGFVR